MGLIRLFLALIVAGDHFMENVLIPAGYSRRGIDQWVGVDAGLAVFLFYVISGFLISYALSRKYRSDTVGFYRNRFIRIFSVYWPMLAVCAALFPYGEHGLLDRLSTVFIVGTDWLVPFADYGHEYAPGFKMLGVAWSLGAELTFYAMAPWLLRSAPLSIAALLASFGLRLILQAHFGFHAVWTYHFFPSALCFFLIGHVARVAADRWPEIARLWPVWFTAAAATVPLRLETGGFLSPWLYIGMTAFALMLPGLFAATKNIRLFNTIGDASYPLYLSHMIVLAMILPIVRTITQIGAPLLLAFLLIVTVLAVGLHFVIERPCSTMMRSILTGAPMQWLRRIQFHTPAAAHHAGSTGAADHGDGIGLSGRD